MAFPTFKTKDEIPKGFEGEYEERDGAWHPKAPDTSKLEETLAKVRDERKAEEKARKAAEADRADLERKLAAAGSGEEKDKVTKALAKFDADLAVEKGKFQKQLDAATAELRTLKLDDKIKAAFLKAGGRSERADKALNDTKGRLDLADDGRIVVKDGKGEITTATVADFFGKTYRAEMAEFYTGTKATGGGASGGAGAHVVQTGKMTPDEIVANPLRALQEANATAA
jgi:hypothetical protein